MILNYRFEDDYYYDFEISREELIYALADIMSNNENERETLIRVIDYWSLDEDIDESFRELLTDYFGNEAYAKFRMEM